MNEFEMRIGTKKIFQLNNKITQVIGSMWKKICGHTVQFYIIILQPLYPTSQRTLFHNPIFYTRSKNIKFLSIKRLAPKTYFFIHIQYVVNHFLVSPVYLSNEFFYEVTSAISIPAFIDMIFFFNIINATMENKFYRDEI